MTNEITTTITTTTIRITTASNNNNTTTTTTRNMNELSKTRISTMSPLFHSFSSSFSITNTNSHSAVDYDQQQQQQQQQSTSKSKLTTTTTMTRKRRNMTLFSFLSSSPSSSSSWWWLPLFVLWTMLAITVPAAAAAAVANNNNNNNNNVPNLNGFHLDITVVPDNIGFADYLENPITKQMEYSGYYIEVLRAIAKPYRANFTFTFHTPSGYGSLCPNNLQEQLQKEQTSIDCPTDSYANVDDESSTTTSSLQLPYPKEYRGHYECGQSDVTDPRNAHNYTTDMYLGDFYITTERMKLNDFTVPLYPPATGTQAMIGTATYINTFEDFLQQQQDGIQRAACITGNTAYARFIRKTFPTMKLIDVEPTQEYIPLNEGICDVWITGHHFGGAFVKELYETNRCLANGKPVGIIGDPLGFGLNYISFGLRKDLPPQVKETLDYWLLDLMSCSPNTECPDDSLAVLYEAGTGRECGYVQNPPRNVDSGLKPPVVAGIVIAAVVLVTMVSSMVYLYKLKKQEKRFRKRFVQQIARNITIGPSPSCIPVDKLAEEVQHIGNKDGIITKEELLKWMCDVKLEFISDKDFNALWSAMDVEQKGEVNAIDFFVFLSACGNEFEQVYQEQAAMPKTERLKWAARRLSNINKLGENGVRSLQHRLERQSLKNNNTGGASLSFASRGGGGGGGGGGRGSFQTNHFSLPSSSWLSANRSSGVSVASSTAAGSHYDSQHRRDSGASAASSTSSTASEKGGERGEKGRRNYSPPPTTVSIAEEGDAIVIPIVDKNTSSSSHVVKRRISFAEESLIMEEEEKSNNIENDNNNDNNNQTEQNENHNDDTETGKQQQQQLQGEEREENKNDSNDNDNNNNVSTTGNTTTTPITATPTTTTTTIPNTMIANDNNNDDIHEECKIQSDNDMMIHNDTV